MCVRGATPGARVAARGWDLKWRTLQAVVQFPCVALQSVLAAAPKAIRLDVGARHEQSSAAATHS
eukprot:11212523-Lingulodinium_polyedra.AAC.1